MRSQGTRESLGFYWRSLEAPRYQVNANRSVFYLIFYMSVEERDVSRMSENMKATIWAATHRLGQIRLLLMHEKHKVWKREFGYDRIETAAEMDEKRSRTSTSPVPNPFFYRNMVIPSHPHTPDDFTLEMKVDVEGLRMEINLSQPASSSVIHRRDAPRSIRGQKNPECRNSRLRSVRGQGNPERRRSRLRLVRGQDPRHRE